MQPNLLTLELRNKILDIIFNYHKEASYYHFSVLDIITLLNDEINKKKKSKSWSILSYMSMSERINYKNSLFISEYFIRDYIWNANDDEFVEILSLYFNNFMLNSSRRQNKACEKVIAFLKENGIDLHLNYWAKEIEPEKNIAGLKAYKNVITVAICKSK